MNALLPSDIWVERAHRMVPAFHPRRSATARAYRYLLGTDEWARSPFRRRYEWAMLRPIDASALQDEARELQGEHTFRGFAVANTAPADDHHRCVIVHAAWVERDGGLAFEIEANRFLHHMVRFLVGTMVEVATGRRPRGMIARLLHAPDNRETSAPAPAHGLSLRAVRYPAELYLDEP
jgi:tRNA pseudouridine38-40 synthase